MKRTVLQEVQLEQVIMLTLAQDFVYLINGNKAENQKATYNIKTLKKKKVLSRCFYNYAPVLNSAVKLLCF